MLLTEWDNDIGGVMPMSKRIAAENVKLKRAYDPPAASDGTRILVDRLWPRGVSKANAAIDQWDKKHRAQYHAAQLVWA